LRERCPRCGAELPAVAYYCPICGVKLEEAARPAAAEDKQPRAEAPGRPGQVPPEAPRGSSLPPAPPAWRVPPVSGPMMLSPAFWAGVVGGVLVGVPGTNICPCLWMLSCGILAVFFFRKQFGRAALPNEAARLGVLAGFFGFLVAFVVSIIALGLIQRSPFGLVEYVQDKLKLLADAYEKMNRHKEAGQIRDTLATPGGLAAILMMLATIYLFSFLLLGTLGGLLAGVFSRRRD